MVKNPLLIFFLLICSSHASPQASEDGCRKLIDKGYSYLYRFMPIEAMKEYQSAIQMAKQIGNNTLYGKAMFGAGQATWYVGNFQHAADTVKLAIQNLSDDKVEMIGAVRILSNIYDDICVYVNAFKTVQQALAMNDDADQQNKILSYLQIGKLYKNVGDYETALSYYAKAQAEEPERGGYPFRELNHCLGELYIAKNQPDSANYFYRRAFIGNPQSRVIRLRIGESFLLQNQPDSAAFYFDPLYKEAKDVHDINIYAGAALGLAKIAQVKHDLKTAIQWAQQSFDFAKQKGMFIYQQNAAELLASLYETAGSDSRALYYQKLYTTLKEAASSDVYKGQLFNFKQKNQQSQQAATLKSLEADKKLAQRTMLIMGLFAILVIVLIIGRHKNENLRLKQRAAELEMQALRAQMNPHFIFNCLSAINHFILNKEPDKASDYLTRFSRLMRMVLVNAGKESISLEEELDMLRLYLDMEQLRFKDAFGYTITVSPGLQPSMIAVPCFILQPFCENAIWHGLLHKEDKGYLRIDITMERRQLLISIKDNGVGMEKAAQLKTKTTESMGQKLTASRLALFNRSKNNGSHFLMKDIRDADGNTAGTEVILRINIPNTHD